MVTTFNESVMCKVSGSNKSKKLVSAHETEKSINNSSLEHFESRKKKKL